MSYKFQRLREKIRSAIASGELADKLPGERALAKRFHVNAKTLSKALTDLAAEGLLDRSIGRGTYVKGTAPATPDQSRWLIIADEGAERSPVIHALRAANPEIQLALGVAEIRPSYLNQFGAVVDMASGTPETFLRDLVVRNMPIVAVNREPRHLSTHCVLIDEVLGVSRLGRDLMLAGHSRFAAIEPRGSTVVTVALKNALTRYAPHGSVDACTPEEVGALLDTGITALICGSSHAAAVAKSRLDQAGIRVPQQMSLAAVGCSCACDGVPCSGYYCDAQSVADAIIGLLRDAPANRPATLWLAGTWHDLGTTGLTGEAPPAESLARHNIGLAG